MSGQCRSHFHNKRDVGTSHRNRGAASSGDEDISIAGDGSGSDSSHAAAGRITLTGPDSLFLVVASMQGLWSTIAHPWPAEWPMPGPDQVTVLGVALASSWAFRAIDSQASSDVHQRMRHEALRVSRANALGYIETLVHRFAGLVMPLLRDTNARVGVVDELDLAPVRVVTPGQGQHNGNSLGEVMRVWRRDCGGRVRSVQWLHVSPFVAGLLSGTCHVLHSVALTRRCCRNRFLDWRQPSRRNIARLVQHALQSGARASNPAPQRLGRIPRWSSQMIDPGVLVDWLDATRYLLDVREAPQAAGAFARLLSHSGQATRAQLMQSLPNASYTTLRKARIKLDCVAMMLWRDFWRVLLHERASSLSVHIFCDSSPQRAAELFACTVDIFDGEKFWRCFLPALALDPTMLDGTGKTVALLWACWLIVGPAWGDMKSFCQRVVSITTDMGVERNIGGMVDMLPEFYHLIDQRFDMDAHPAEGMLFPRCVGIPGWKHGWDNVLQRALSTLRWFPLFLLRLKALVAFLRVPSHLTAIARTLKRARLHALSEVIQEVKLPSFAEWRWGTLLQCTTILLGFLDGLIIHFDPAPFARSRDRQRLTAVMAAFASDEWRRQLEYTHYIASWLVGLQQWGGGCDCHEEQLTQGASISCPWKGRRLANAFPHIQSELRRVLQESSQWTTETWQLGDRGLLECQGCVRGAVALARMKFQWADRLPYLLARLHEPGIARRCQEQWLSVPPAQHHRVSRYFMEGALRQEIDAVLPDGSGISARLRAALRGFDGVPFDDSVAEGPHARASRIAKHARASRWPWIASTLRLSQNIDTVRELLPIVGGDLRSRWCGSTSVIRHGGRWPLQRPRMSHGKFVDYVYRMSFCHEAEEAGADGEEDASGGDDDDDDDDSGGPGGPDHGTTAGAGSSGGRGAGGGAPPPDNDSDHGGDESGGHPAPRKRNIDTAAPLRESQVVKLLRAYLHASLELHDVISLPAMGDEGHIVHLFFQILRLESRPVLIETFSSPSDDRGLYTCTVQPYSRWNPNMDDASSDPPIEADCFVYQDPCEVDLLTISGARIESRKQWLSWQTKPSAIEGCLAMHSPRILAPQHKLSHRSVPVLCLVDALEAAGLVGTKRKTTHSPDGSAEYDCRSLPSKRTYLQAVLACEELFEAGVPQFASGHSSSYYAVLLRTKKLPDPAAGAVAYKKQLASLDGDELGLKLLSRPAGSGVEAASAVFPTVRFDLSRAKWRMTPMKTMPPLLPRHSRHHRHRRGWSRMKSAAMMLGNLTH